MQAKGLKLKSKTLKDVLKSTFEMEPKLIGYNEIPIDVTDSNIVGQKMVNEDLCSKSDPEIHPIGQRLQSSPDKQLRETVRNHDCSSDLSRTGNIKTIVVLK